MIGVLIVGIICATGIFISEGDKIIKEVSEYKNKKLDEERKTTNLALVYQILSARPELSLEEVLALVDKQNNLLERK